MNTFFAGITFNYNLMLYLEMLNTFYDRPTYQNRIISFYFFNTETQADSRSLQMQKQGRVYNFGTPWHII